MKERARNGAANLLEDHIFQFDFLNDSFDKLPPRLREIIDDEEKRRRLVIYINPPYAEAATTTQKTGSGRNKAKVADTQVARRLKEGLGPASNELFAQFLMRAYTDIPLSVLANFSKLKNLQAPNFHVFRKHFQARLARIFLVPASLFDNVKGFFPIGFFIWRTAEKEVFTSIKADVYDRELTLTGRRNLYAPPVGGLLMDWLKTLHDKEGERIAYLRMLGSDVQNNAGVFITNTPSESDLKQRKTCNITRNNLLGTAVYFAVRMVVDTTWVNDRDQYLFPQPGWSDDRLFQADCLAYTLFSGQNRINAAGGVNYWIPFTEEEVDARDSFRSHFMSDFISGRKRHVKNSNSWVVETDNAPLEFSEEAKAVLDAGRELWRYYHAQEDADPDASFYDIKMYFQGTKVSKSGKVQMRPDSDDAHYTELIGALRSALKALAAKIEPKVYEHGFLKR